jgi:hypothetical protein
LGFAKHIPRLLLLVFLKRSILMEPPEISTSIMVPQDFHILSAFGPRKKMYVSKFHANSQLPEWTNSANC